MTVNNHIVLVLKFGSTVLATLTCLTVAPMLKHGFNDKKLHQIKFLRNSLMLR